MENTEMQSTFEEKVNITDLVLPSDPTILNAEFIDLKEEPLEKGGKNTVSIHKSKKKQRIYGVKFSTREFL